MLLSSARFCSVLLGTCPVPLRTCVLLCSLPVFPGSALFCSAPVFGFIQRSVVFGSVPVFCASLFGSPFCCSVHVPFPVFCSLAFYPGSAPFCSALFYNGSCFSRSHLFRFSPLVGSVLLCSALCSAWFCSYLWVLFFSVPLMFLFCSIRVLPCFFPPCILICFHSLPVFCFGLFLRSILQVLGTGTQNLLVTSTELYRQTHSSLKE